MSIIGKHNILIPKNVDLQKWAVVACDQFTSQPDYWEKLERFVDDKPSALNLILPEFYLNDKPLLRIQKINTIMKSYLDNNIFKEIQGFILVEREVEFGKKRIGLLLSVDLESYEYKRLRCPIRATEDTILERLPARISIRENAHIELPHILMLIDDLDKHIIEPLYANRNKLEILYDFELNMGGGHIRGYKVDKVDDIIYKLEKLLDKQTQIDKYGWDANLLFTVGDGNHSLASAKNFWDEIKNNLNTGQRKNHPARYALVEVENIYDDALFFEPIHRVLLNCDLSFIDELKSVLKGNGSLKLFTCDREYVIPAPSKSSELIHEVQTFIECYISRNISKVDYVHGDEHLKSVVKENPNSIGIFMPYFAKDELFNYVLNIGNLPKKAFSISGPQFKRYYLEAKKIR